MIDREAESAMMRRVVQARWDPQMRHDSTMRKIEQLIHRSQRGHRPVAFTKEDRVHINQLMGGRVKKRTADSAVDTPTSQTDERQAV